MPESICFDGKTTQIELVLNIKKKNTEAQQKVQKLASGMIWMCISVCGTVSHVLMIRGIQYIKLSPLPEKPVEISVGHCHASLCMFYNHVVSWGSGVNEIYFDIPNNIHQRKISHTTK